MVSNAHLTGASANLDALMEYAKTLGFGEIFVKFDPEVQLTAIIGLHNTYLGPAIGGCRCLPYEHYADALYDAMRLACGMTYKSAISGLPHGGGKAVLMRPSTIVDRKKYFAAFGRFVNELGGRYVTAMDSGVTAEDMSFIALETEHVLNRTPEQDPSPYTARGLVSGIQEAVAWKLKKDSLAGVRIVLQGLGHVGTMLQKDCMLWEHICWCTIPTLIMFAVA